MASANEIVNMALAQVGGDLVEDYTDTDDETSEAVLARLFYATVVDAVFEMYEWPFAYSVVTKATVASSVAELDDDTEYTHSLARNAAWNRIVTISEDGTFTDRVVWQASTGFIYTQAEAFSIKYINDVAEANWPNAFTLAVASALAWKFSFPLTKSKDIQQAMQNQFAVDLELAQDAEDFHAPMADTTNNVRVLEVR